MKTGSTTTNYHAAHMAMVKKLTSMEEAIVISSGEEDFQIINKHTELKTENKPIIGLDSTDEEDDGYSSDMEVIQFFRGNRKIPILKQGKHEFSHQCMIDFGEKKFVLKKTNRKEIFYPGLNFTCLVPCTL